MKGMNRRSCAVVLAVVSFGIICLLSETCLQEKYVFQWNADICYCASAAAMAAAVLLGISGALTLSYSLTLGNTIGMFFGQYFGEFLVAQKVAQLPPAPSNDEVYWAHYQHGVFLWLAVVLLFFFAGLAWDKWQRRQREKK